MNFLMQSGGIYGKGNSSENGAATSYGGGGGYNTSLISINPESQLVITVGKFGNNHVDNSNASDIINATSGFVLIAYGEGIE